MFGPIAAFESYLFNALKLRGRASRSEYWWPALIVGLLLLAVTVADTLTIYRALAQGQEVPTGLLSYWSPILSLLVVVPNFTSSVRRLHDIGKSGLLMLIGAVPVVGGLILLVLMLLPSEERANAWGQPRTPGGARPAGAREGRAAPERKHNPLDAYALLLQTEVEPSADEVARRKEEIHDYFVRNVSRRATAA